jgi:transposase
MEVVMAKKRKSTKTRKMKTLHVIEPNAAGVDIGATEIYVAVPEDRTEKPVRRFLTFTEDLHEAAKWLKQCAVQSVVMESTGVYWIPFFQILESYGFEVLLVNARHVKNVPGRKSDVQDCQWLQYLHSVGLLRGSYRPPQEVCAVRSLLRHRDNMLKISSSHVQHMQKSLTQMNIQIHHVISDITGVTGMAIIEAILCGERDPGKLADLRDPRIKASKKVIKKALKGDYREEHLFTLSQALASYRHYLRLIQECDREMEKLLNTFDSRVDPDQSSPSGKSSRKKPQGNEPSFDLRSHMYRILGTDLTQIDGVQSLTAHVFFAEVGPDLSKFEKVSHFCSWLGLCPNNKVSGGKVLSRKTRRGANRLAHALRLSARSLWHSQSYLGEYYRRMRARLGAPKAITATANKLARVIYHLVKHGKEYDESVFAKQDELHKKRLEKRLRYQANALGFQLVPANAAA